MEEKISLREQLKRFEAGQYNDPSVRVQIEASWFDWFCRDTSLAAKTKSLYRILQRISASPKINLDKCYAFLKNNCPVNGSLYDSISICDLETGDVLFWITPSNGHNGVHKGKAKVYDKSIGFDSPVAVGKVKDIVTWFNVAA